MPFGFYFGQSLQVEAAETEHLFYYPENRFERLLALAVNRACRFGGHQIGYGLPLRIFDCAVGFFSFGGLKSYRGW